MNIPLVPIIWGIILGTMSEGNLRKALILSKGSYLVFIQKPISLMFLIFTIIALVVPLVVNIQTMRSEYKERIAKKHKI
jgi:putative tricarboxylic transport membrane protein